jgi:glycosyltransferase involved in cell wall biosynthesis
MIASLKRWVIETQDRLRYSPFVRHILSQYRLFRDSAPPADDPQAVARSLVGLCSAARLALDSPLMPEIEKRIRQRLQLLDAGRLDWKEFAPDVDSRKLTRAAILKRWAGPREKGVLFISFEDQWARLLPHVDSGAFAREYDLVLAPSWSPPHSLINCVFGRVYAAPLFVLISNSADLAMLPRLAPNYLPVPLLASSWVNPGLFRPRPRAERDIDIVMVANWGRIKRHHILFRALRSLPAALRVVVIGREQDGRTVDTIRAEARCYGVEGRVNLVNDLPYEKVAETLCRARVSVVLSRREGSCVAVAESLFANTPVGLLANAHIGSKAFINKATGRLLHESDLAAQLLDFVQRAGEYRPRAWADQNISCFRSTATLNEIIKRHALASGQEWTEDIAPVCWRPDPALVHAEDQSRREVERRRIRERFGIDIEP